MIAAAEVGTPEAFGMAGEVSMYLLGVPIEDIPAMADPATAEQILERIEGHE